MTSSKYTRKTSQVSPDDNQSYQPLEQRRRMGQTEAEYLEPESFFFVLTKTVLSAYSPDRLQPASMLTGDLGC